MAHFSERKFIVGGKPVIVLSGEVHYFRLKRSDWQDRIDKAKQAGCNCIGSYIPWIYHEEAEGQIDLTGLRRPETDLGAFIDLCKQAGLWFIPRPGPFIMAEVKNEGIPDWIYTKYPDAAPVTWGGKKVTSKNLNYLDQGFLKATERWYQAVMPIIRDRLDSRGGNVIAVQLDNEIGMLQCWTEEADLSDDTLCQFAEWAQKKHSGPDLRQRYPFDLGDPIGRAGYLRDGTFPGALNFHQDYTEFTRDRFAQYAAKLRQFTEASGVKDVPFIINLHGSGGGRATTFPIGISQCYKAYSQAKEFWPSSDHYLGDMTRQNAGDLYFLNAFMACTAHPEQPLSSVEFEAGTGDYGENGAIRYSGAATDFKARLSVVQGNRMLNHYLLAGGHNPMLEKPKEDGNSRVGTTGLRHGFAAPIGPEGRLDSTYHALKLTNESLLAVGDLLAQMYEEHDELALGFVPDYYSTDVKKPAPMQALAAKLESARGPLEGMVRAFMSQSLSFPAVNLQAPIPKEAKAIALAAATCLAVDVQHRLAEFVFNGGNLLLYGKLPTEDLVGERATVLLDFLGITPEPMRQASSSYFPSLVGEAWAKDEPEIRVWQVQPFKIRRGTTFLRLHQTDLVAGAVIPHGKGHVIVVSTELPMHPLLWNSISQALGATPEVTHDAEEGGVLVHRIRDRSSHRFISLINLDQEPKSLHLRNRAKELLIPERIQLAGRTAKLLPLFVQIGGLTIDWATTEIAQVKDRAVAFRQTPYWEQVHLNPSTPGSIEPGIQRRQVQNRDSQVQEIPPGDGIVWIQRT